MNKASYFLGFFDGEGSLMIRFSKEKRKGWSGHSVSFRCEITNNNYEVLEFIKNYFNMGKIRVDKRSNAYIWRIDSKKEIRKIIDFLDKHKPIVKYEDFKIFKQAFNKYTKRPKKKVEKALVEEIYELRRNMNGGEKSTRKPL